MNAPCRTSVGELAQNLARLLHAILRRFVIAGFDGGLAFLFQPAGIEELLTLDGICGAVVANVRELERYLPLEVDQFGWRRRRRRRTYVGQNCQGEYGRRKTRTRIHRREILLKRTSFSTSAQPPESETMIKRRLEALYGGLNAGVLRTFSDPIAREHPVERRAGDAEQIGGAASIAFGLFERTDQRLLDHVIQQESG